LPMHDSLIERQLLIAHMPLIIVNIEQRRFFISMILIDIARAISAD